MNDIAIAAKGLATALNACRCALPPDASVDADAVSILFQAYVSQHCAQDFPAGWIHSRLTH